MSILSIIASLIAGVLLGFLSMFVLPWHSIVPSHWDTIDIGWLATETGGIVGLVAGCVYSWRRRR